MWKSVFSALAIVAVAALPAVPAAAADSPGSETSVLRDAGQAVEIRGLRTRVIAFYEGSGERIALTVLLSGGTLGPEVLRAHLGLRDGQRHAVVMDPGDDAGSRERFSFARRGDVVVVRFEPLPPAEDTRLGAERGGGTATRLARLDE